MLFGNLRETYIVVARQGVTLTVDPFSAGFCTLYNREGSGAVVFAPTLRGYLE